MSSPSATLPSHGNDYPGELERTMPQTERHRNLMWALIQALVFFFRNMDRVYASGDLLIFYERGNHHRHVSPDVFVACDVEKRERRNYLVWDEGHAPDFVIEIVSESTVANDQGEKFLLYQSVLRVSEYFLFDPEGTLLTPRLAGYRLVGGVYQPIQPVAGRLPSQVTGLHLEMVGDPLRLWDPATRAWLLNDAERAEQETTRADDEAARADDEAARADEQRKRADDAEKRIRELEAELARRGGSAT
jgi:Uma2 family endonuclease